MHTALFQFNRAEFALIMPEVELVMFGLGILLIDFVLDEGTKYVNAALALAATAFSAFTLFGMPDFMHGVLEWMRLGRFFVPGLRRTSSEMGVQTGFHNSIAVDPFFIFFAVIFLVSTALVVLLSVRYLEIEREHHGEYYALLLFACAGMMFMVSGIDLIVQFLGLETMALSFYVLTGFLRRERRSNEAAMKYVLLGAFSSGILAYGFSLLYGLSGSTNISVIGQALGERFAFAQRVAGAITLSHETGPRAEMAQRALEAFFGNGHHPLLLVQLLPMVAFVTVAAGLFFKIAAVPFHQWAPDVYEGAPTPITAYVSVASKTASFALLLRLFIYVFGSSQEYWLFILSGVAIASLTWGNFAALTQNNVKRLLAYSSISHVGYILLGVVGALSTYPQLNRAGMTGIAFYLFVYAFMTTGAFAVIIVLRRKGIIGDDIEDLNGLFQRSPGAALLLLIFMLSLAGIPPTAGFLGKYYIFQSLIETHHPVLAVFAALYIVPALYYYFRVVVHAWMKQPGDAPRPVMSIGQMLALTVTAFVTLAAGLYPEPFAQFARYAVGLGR